MVHNKTACGPVKAKVLCLKGMNPFSYMNERIVYGKE